MLALKQLFNFSVEQLGQQRSRFQHKLCFKQDRESLKLKSSPTIAIACRLMRDGKFLTLYRNCLKFYYMYVLPKVYNLPANNEYKNFYFQYQSFKDFNRVLFWKIMSINPLFSLKRVKKRKLLYYLKPKKRMVLILSWLKYIIKLSKKNSHNNTQSLFKPVYIFLSTQRENNEIYNLKLKLYKMRLMRG